MLGDVFKETVKVRLRKEKEVLPLPVVSEGGCNKNKMLHELGLKHAQRDQL